MTAVRTRIADQLVPLIEGLREVEGLLRAEAEQAIAVALEFGEVVERGRGHALGLRLDGFDGGLAGARAVDDHLGLLAVYRAGAHGLAQRSLSAFSAVWG